MILLVDHWILIKIMSQSKALSLYYVNKSHINAKVSLRAIQAGQKQWIKPLSSLYNRGSHALV